MNTINHRYRLHLNNYFKFISDVYSNKRRQITTQQFVSPKASSNSDVKILKTAVFSGEIKPISSDGLKLSYKYSARKKHKLVQGRQQGIEATEGCRVDAPQQWNN